MHKRLSQYIRSSGWFVWYATLLPALFTANSAKAQVTSTADGTGTTVTQSGNTFDITDGTQTNGNLFHKFDDFSVESSETVNFTSDSSVFNIVGQVAGGNPSYIEGQVQVSGSDADLYLINPSGVLFGPDAQVSLSGSLTVTSADQVGFGADWLDVLDSSPDYTPLSADPSALRFTGTDAGAVVNQANLAVAPDESLLIVGGNVISEGRLEAAGGEVGLVAVGGQSTVQLTTPGSLLSLEVTEGGVFAGTPFTPTDLPALLTGKVGVGADAIATGLTVAPDGSVLLTTPSSPATIEPNEVVVSGVVSTRSLTAEGGTIGLFGQSVDVVGATVDASGTQGGTILIGENDASAPRASLALIRGSNISADGLTGGGGTIDTQADFRIEVSRSSLLSAQGNTQGGSITTATNRLAVDDSVTLDAGGQTAVGEWLLDVSTVDIVDGAANNNEIDPDTISAVLDTNTSVSIEAGRNNVIGDIALLSDLNQTGTSSAGLSLSGRRFATNGSEINLASTGQLTFGINQVNPFLITNPSSIDSAIRSIGNVNGDRVINLGAGTYDFFDPVVVDTDVSIVGDSSSDTILRAVDSNRVFEIDANVTADINNLTLTTAGLAATQSGGGIENSGDLSVSNSIFVDNRSDFGGAIRSSGNSTLTISDSEFNSNSVTAQGGAIDATNATVSISNTAFSNNSADDIGGGLRVTTNSLLSVTDSRFENNTARRGGGATVQSSTATITGSTFSGNHVTSRGGGLYAITDETVDVSGSTFDSNTSDNDGAGITVDSSGVVTITDSDIINNVAGDDGGGLHHIDGTAVLSNVRVINNSANDLGGGIYQFDSADLTLVDSFVRDNSAGNDGGGLMNNSSFTADTTIIRTDFENNTANRGGGLFSLAGGTVALTDSSFMGNEATQSDGGAVYVTNSAALDIEGGSFDGNSANVDGGAIAATDAAGVNVVNATFTNNSTNDDGGAIAATGAASVNIVGATFTNNNANDDGGGLFVEDTPLATVRNATFESNSAGDDGGGIYAIVDSQITISNTALTNNDAMDMGGGVYSRSNSTVTIDKGSIISGNSARAGGGIATNNAATGSSIGSALTVIDSTIRGNTATQQGGGIASMSDSRELVVARSLIEANTAAEGGGIYSVADSTLSLNDATLRANESTVGSGGGLFALGSVDVDIVDSAFDENISAGDGGAIFYSSLEDLTITDTTFSLNEAASDGGAIAHLSPNALALTGTDFSRNSAQGTGGALNVSSASSANISDATFFGNTAVGEGGALKSEGTDIAVFATTFTDNSTSANGGAASLLGNNAYTFERTDFVNNQAVAQGGGLWHSFGTLSIEQSDFIDNDGGDRGGGLFTEGAQTVLIANSKFINNQADRSGGGLRSDTAANLEIVGSTFQGNESRGDGGGLFMNTSGTGTVSVRDSFLLDNIAGDDGGALQAEDDLSVVVNNTVIENNSANDAGGGIYHASGSALTLTNSVVSGNRAIGQGGGILNADSSGALLIADTDFESNVASMGGGLYSAASQPVVLTRTNFVGNEATVGEGGAINSVDGASFDIVDSTFDLNQAALNGGAIALQGATALNINRTGFEGNTAGAEGGAIYAADASRSIITDATIDGNQAEHGGGIALRQTADLVLRESLLQNNVAAVDGGGVRALNNATATIEQSSISNNSARHGGALELSGESAAVVSDSEFTDNQVTMFGGGVLVDNASTLNLSRSTLSNNQALAGGGAFVRGTANLVNTTISGNSASQDGGGVVLLDEAGALTVGNSTITNNQASEAGGVSVRSALAAANLANTIVAANTATTPDSSDVKGRFVDGGSNLVGIGDAATGFLDGSYVGSTNTPLDPGLEVLADNGGATRTHLLRSESAAINAGTSVLLPATDQRGFARAAGAAVDIGAVEMTAGELPADVFNAIAPNVPTDPTPVDPPVDPTPVDPPIDPPVDPTPTDPTPTDPTPTDPTPTDPTPTDPAPTPSVVSPEEPNLEENNPSDPNGFSTLVPLPTDIKESEMAVLHAKKQDESNADDVAVRKLEQTFGQSFEDYWDLSLGPDLSFSEVQAILRRANEEYQVNSAVIYASFAPEETAEATEQETDSQEDVLTVEPEPLDSDLLNLSLVMPEGELVSYQLPYTRQEVTQQVRLFRSTVSDPADDFSYQPFSQRVYQWLLAPLEDDLAAQGIQNLMYALDTGLRTAPITAMRDYYGYSLERYGISVVPNMGLMQADFGVPVRRATVAMGVAEFDSQAPLPAVPVELSMVDEFVTASQTVLNEGTTLEAIEKIQAVEQPGILHLATHADFDSRSPESSSIHLWDSPLSMAEFRQLDWQGSDLEMLILSACSTAMSSPKAGLGFAGLAAASGVDATVGSLWQVSDVGTLALMSEFYAQLETTDLRVEALRRAQLALIKGETRIEDGDLITSRGEVDLPDDWEIPQNATLEHPFFWSAFTLVGNPW